MKKILFISLFLFINYCFAQYPTCKRIVPLSNTYNELIVLSNGEKLLSGNGTIDKYDSHYNLLSQISANAIQIREFGNFVFYIQSAGSGNFELIKLDKVTMTQINSTTIVNRSAHSFDIDNTGNLYLFVNNFTNQGSNSEHYSLIKFDTNLNILFTKNYNPNSGTEGFSKTKNIAFVNNKLIIAGFLINNRTITLDNVSISHTDPSGFHLLFLTLNVNDGSVENLQDLGFLGLSGAGSNDLPKIFSDGSNVFVMANGFNTSSQNFTSGIIRKYTVNGSLIGQKIISTSSRSNFLEVINFKNNLITFTGRSIGSGNGNVNLDNGFNLPIGNNDSYYGLLNLNLQTLDAKVILDSFYYGIFISENEEILLLGRYLGNSILQIDDQTANNIVQFIAELDVSVGYKSIDFYQQGTTPNPTNPNNYVNQDLPIRFKVKVNNELAQSLSTLSGTITSTTTGVTITDNSVNFAALSSGSSIWSNDEFEIIVDPSVANGTQLEFELSCNDPFVTGGPWVSSFSFPVAPLETGTVLLVDNLGDNDGIPEPGENAIKVQPKINNISNNTIANVFGTLSSEDTFLTFTSNFQKYNWISNIHEPIEPTDTDITPEFPFEFDYPSSAALQELNFNLELQGKLNDSNGALLKWQTNFTYNQGVEPPPVITSTNPIDNATDIAINTNFEITFDKNITAVTGKFIHLYKVDNSLISNIEATNSQISISNKVVTINPTADLLGGTGYYITIDQGAFIDATNNDFAGISSPTTWNFTTIQSNPPNAPVLTATAISDTEIELSWNAVGTATNYQLFSCDESTTYTTTETGTTYTITGLTKETVYDFIVKAENPAGLSDASNCANATTFCNNTWGTIITYGNQLITAYGIVTIDGNPASEGDIVGAFVGSELRGIGNVVISDGVAYTTIAIENNGTETFSFIIWNQSDCDEIPIAFTIDASGGDVIGLPPNFLPINGERNTASVINENLEHLIMIYPNPTDDFVYIKINNNLIINQIKIYDLTGKLLNTFKDNYENISMKNYASGIYFVRIESDKGFVIKEIIKN